jgi:peptidoglycan/LPS O-acetylase OafA/YrhL
MHSSSKRYHEFDALRSFAMLLGIVLHGALAYTYLPIWPAQDIHQNHQAYSLLQHAIHGFRMPAFFVISGFFTAMMWQKRGTKGLLSHRAKRILLPLALGTFTLSPLIYGISYWGSIEKNKRPASANHIWNAARTGNLSTLKQLLQSGTNPNERDTMRIAPIEWAAIANQPETISFLVENGANVHGANPDGSTALHSAAFFGQLEAAQRLIDLGCNPDTRNRFNQTPLDSARLDMSIVHAIGAAINHPTSDPNLPARRQQVAAYLAPLTSTTNSPALNPSKATATNSFQFPEIVLAATFIPIFHHLWFLYYLLWLIALYLVTNFIARKLKLTTPSWLIKTPHCLLWLIPLTLLPQLLMTQTFGVDTATGILPWPPTLIYYAIFFLFGTLCYARPEFEERAGKKWLLWFALALPTLLAGLHFLETRESNPTSHLLSSLLAATYAWLMFFGLTGLFRQFFSRENPRIRYLSDSSYWLYLAHLPLIMSLQIWTSNWNVHHFPKFILVCTTTFALLILIYEYGIRYSPIGTLLNGPKTRTRPEEQPSPSPGI